MEDKITAKPFVKWAGGKRQILDNISLKLPKSLGKTYNKYCEPFVGGGTVLFYILSNYNMKEVLINDINADLINTYNAIKSYHDSLISKLQSIQKKYIPLNDELRKHYYYEKRDEYNSLKLNHTDKTSIQRAALFIFLNRTCFNGLYRVNSSGEFNVPMGLYKNPTICDENNIRNVSKLLKNVIIKSTDYSECLKFIDNHTFVYIDPPYRPITQSSNFTSYTQFSFNDSEQIRLGNFVTGISKDGSKILLSNSDPKNNDENDNFFDNLYHSFQIERISARRNINSNKDKRGYINELLISNY